jgi:hypothetical protein
VKGAPFILGIVAGVASLALGGMLARWSAQEPGAPAAPFAALASSFGVGSGGAAEPPATVALSIDSTPEGAQVRVDGQPRGETPVDVLVAPGEHRVAIERPRYATVELDTRAPGHIVAQLERPFHRLRIFSTPSGARITVDGHYRGRAPVEVDTRAYEHHKIAAELDGMNARRRIYFRPDEEITMMLSR